MKGDQAEMDRKSYGALRVMADCNQMGEAAARAVVNALCRRKEKSLKYPLARVGRI